MYPDKLSRLSFMSGTAYGIRMVLAFRGRASRQNRSPGLLGCRAIQIAYTEAGLVSHPSMTPAASCSATCLRISPITKGLVRLGRQTKLFVLSFSLMPKIVSRRLNCHYLPIAFSYFSKIIQTMSFLNRILINLYRIHYK